MIYLSQMLGKPVLDSAGNRIGTINDIAIATREVFPRVTALAFLGPDKTPFMLSWRKYVEQFDGDSVVLNVTAPEIRFSYLQPDEVLLARDLLNKQIVDTHGKKVVRVRDLKLSDSRNQMRLLGADVGVRGLLRARAPWLERVTDRIARMLGSRLTESIIAWNYMDLLDRDLGRVKLSVTHKRLHELHPADIADILEELEPAQRARVFAYLDDKLAADAFSEMEDDYQADIMEELTAQRASDILEIMEPDEAADIIGDLPREQAEKLLRLMGLEESRQVRALLGYRENSAGGVMTPDVITVTYDSTAEQVIERLRTASLDHEWVNYVYVTDGDGRLWGVVTLRDLLLAEPTATVNTFAEHDLMTAHPDDDQEQVAEVISKYDLLALPVVDEAGELLGAVTIDDVVDVLRQEHTEDFEKFMAITGSHETGAYLTTPALTHFSNRVRWVVVLAAVGLISGSIIHRYEGALESLIILALYMPMLADTGGNTGSQSATVVVRALAMGEIRPRDAVKVLRKEVVVAVLMAVILAVMAYGKVWLLSGGTVLPGGYTLAQVGFAISVALGLQVVTSTLVGAMLPIGATKLKLDPAIVSSPALTTIVDITGLLIYFNVATLMLGISA
jgi:magnesium transporter